MALSSTISAAKTGDSTRTIWRSAAIFFSGTMLSRFSGMFRDMAMAYAFGTQSAVAALLVAFRFAHLLRRLLGEGAMQTALVPHFEELRAQNPVRAAKFFCDLAISLSTLISALVVVIMAFLGLLLYSEILSPGNAEIAWLTLLMMPSLLFICLFGINASLMQCEKSYFIPSAAPILFNALWILGVGCTFTLPPMTAMSLMSVFIIAACLAQWAVTLPQTYSIIKSFGVNTVLRGAKLFSTDVRRLAHPLTLGIIGIAASQINNALDAVFARWASEEGPALLWYAIRLQQLPLALFGIAIGGAILPPLSRAAKEGNIPLFSHLLDFGLLRTAALILPITAILFVLGDRCVALIYGHGSFSNASVVGTTQALWGYTLGLIPMAMILVLAPAFYARGDYRNPSMAATAAVGLNAGLNAWLVAGLELGPASIAAATGISAWFNFAWLLIALRKTQSHSMRAWTAYGGLILASVLAALGMMATDHLFFGEFKAWSILQGEIPAYEIPLLDQIVQLAVDGALFAVIFGAVIYPMRSHFRRD